MRAIPPFVVPRLSGFVHGPDSGSRGNCSVYGDSVMAGKPEKNLEEKVEVTEETPFVEEGDVRKGMTRPILFARALFHLKNDWLALEQAGYNCTTSASKSALAWTLKNRPDVQAEYKRLQKLLEKQTVLSIAELDKSVAALNDANLADLVDETGAIKPLKEIPRHLTHAIAEYQTDTTFDKDGNKHVKVKVKLHNKKEVAELLMRRKNLLKGASDGQEVRVRFSFGKVKGRVEKA